MLHHVADVHLNFYLRFRLALTEDHPTICPFDMNAWAELPAEERARLQSRQGVGMIQTEFARVVEALDEESSDDVTLVDVPADGTTMGEIVMRGNNVMIGYYRDPDATAKAFAGGWYHSGDLGVMHPDGYVELRDRAKDVVISGGENISTVEVEHALASHPAVSDVAVIAVPDERWGERPKAFVVLNAGETTCQDDLITHVKAHIAKFKAPKSIDFVLELPRTSTGKIRKHILRTAEWAGHNSMIQG